MLDRIPKPGEILEIVAIDEGDPYYMAASRLIGQKVRADSYIRPTESSYIMKPRAGYRWFGGRFKLVSQEETFLFYRVELIYSKSGEESFQPMTSRWEEFEFSCLP